MKNSKFPLISFIVPVHNVENYIKECIESIINQNDDNFELILVDDGSTDNSLKLCKEYEKMNKKIKVVHKENGGLVSARKYGLKYAKGDYIACVDGDDWIENNYLSTINKVFVDDNPDIIAFNYRKIGKTKVKEMLYFSNKKYNKQSIEKDIYPYLIQNKYGKYFSPSLINKIIRKDIYEKSQYSVSEDVSVGEDFVCLVPCIINANAIVSISDCLYCYRQNNDSLTKSKKPFDWKYPENMINGIESSIKNINVISEQIERKIVHELYSVVFSQFYLSKNYRDIVRDINNILEYEVYKTSINSAKFDSFIFSGLQFLLRNRVLLPFKIISIIKEYKFKNE